MDRETMIRLAREAEISESHAQGMQRFLERFAALVAAAEREQIAQMFEGTGGATQHRDVAAAIRSRSEG